MKCRDIVTFLDSLAPPVYAESWDNPGLLVGDREKEIHKVFVAVDATDEIIEQAVMERADMLVTHHPLIFSGLKSVNEDDFIGRRVRRLIKEDICYFAMHTNFDVAGDMAGLVAEKLPLENTRILHETAEGMGLGRIGNLIEPMTACSLAETVKNKLQIADVVLYGDAEGMVKCIAVMPGSGKSEIEKAVMQGADMMITGDIGHHEGIDALAKGMMILDAGHYGLEKVFVEYMQHTLTEEWKDCVQVAAEKVKQPFTVL